jgi:hypothetical protein
MAISALSIASLGVNFGAANIAALGFLAQDIPPTPTPETDRGGGGGVKVYPAKRKKRRKVRADIEHALKLAVSLENSPIEELRTEALEVIAIAAPEQSENPSVSFVMENDRRLEAVFVRLERMEQILAENEEDDGIAIMLLH